MRLKLVSLLFSLLVSNAYAAVTPTSVTALEKNIRQVHLKIDGLTKEISKLEKQLGSKHTEYLSTIKARQELDNRLVTIERDLANEKNQAKEQAVKLRSILKRLALQELDQHQSAAAMAARKMLSIQVNKQLEDIKRVMSDVQLREQELVSTRNRISSFIETEHRLYELVQTMEEQKKERADAYLAAMGEKSAVEEKLSALRLNQRRKKVTKVSKPSIETRFGSPIDDFLGVEYDKKGITYKFTGRRPVIAAETGEVAYAGRLSTYGNVVLIDHGDETRSVILGQFVPKLNKGQKVTRGDVIGYTENTSLQGKLYFEVRKGDKALDTIALMDQSFLNKHRITKI